MSNSHITPTAQPMTTSTCISQTFVLCPYLHPIYCPSSSPHYDIQIMSFVSERMVAHLLIFLCIWINVVMLAFFGRIDSAAILAYNLNLFWRFSLLSGLEWSFFDWPVVCVSYIRILYSIYETNGSLCCFHLICHLTSLIRIFISVQYNTTPIRVNTPKRHKH